MHVFVLVRDGACVERLLRTLHDRCWLGGLGWLMVGAGGQLLDRSLVDRTVYAGERLVFEGTPVLRAPLVQDVALRAPQVVEGDAVDAAAACPDLTMAERARLRALRQAEAHRLAPDAAASRRTFVDQQVGRVVERAGVTESAARRIVERQCEGVLLQPSCCRSMPRTWPSPRSGMYLQTHPDLWGPPSPTRWRASNMGGARRR